MAKTITFKNNLKKKPNAKITKITVYNKIIYQAYENQEDSNTQGCKP